MSDPGDQPVDVRRNQNPITQGAKYGVTGCAGCATFAVVAILVVIVLLAIAAHH